MDGTRGPGVRHRLFSARYPARRDGVIAIALLVLPWVLVWGLVRHHHLDSTAVAILAAVTIPLAGLWLAWAAFRNASRVGSADNGAMLGIITAGLGPVVDDREGTAIDQHEYQQRRGVTGQPSNLPRVWNIPARNPGFTGRDALLVAVREHLLASERAVVQALHGMGGVGKTQLAAEYAYRFAGSYNLAWWISAEQSSLIGDQFAALGLALGCIEAGAGMDVVREAVLAELRERSRWLLVFDNAENPVDVAGWLPGGSGHVLITSREHGWIEIAGPVEVDVLDRPESVAILQARVAGLTEGDAGLLAAELGDLPLAIAQAAGYMAETGMAAIEYLALLRARAVQLLDQAPPGTYPRSLTAVTNLIADRLACEDPAGAELANLCAFLAPEPIPEDLFTGAARDLPGELAARAADSLTWRATLAHMARQSLARIDYRGLQMHRLTQAILRDRLTSDEAAAARAHTEAILVTGNPHDSQNPAKWPRWAKLMPHLVLANLPSTDNPDLRHMACDACEYLIARRDTSTALDLSSDLRQHWRDRLGDDDPDTLWITHYVAWAFHDMGHYAEARDLDQDTLTRKRRVLGEDARSTLVSASQLAIDLYRVGDLKPARDLAQDTLNRRRNVLGEDDQDTLTSANTLAAILGEVGELQAARDLDQDTLDRMRRVRGEDHLHTLSTASVLTAILGELGELQAARDLGQDTLARMYRVLGENHPSTVHLSSYLRALRKADRRRWRTPIFRKSGKGNGTPHVDKTSATSRGTQPSDP